MGQQIEKREGEQAPTKGTTNPVLRMELTVGTLALGLFIDLIVSGPGRMLGNNGASIIALFVFLAVFVWNMGVDTIVWVQKTKREWEPYLPQKTSQVRKQREEALSQQTEEKSVTTMTRKLEEEDTFLPPLPSQATRPGKEEKSELEAYKRPAAIASLFSQVLRTFMPTLVSIYLGTLLDGTEVYSDAKGLCHVALGGSTGQGKGGLIRLLMSQLCAAGASILLLNPHYTRYDIERDEDWTPFEPYLLHDPMECRQYAAIEFYLKQVATVLLPKRLEKFAHSQPVGKPYFLVLDELPAIIDSVPDAPLYIGKILREGRKVGIFLIAASQDFLVKTISPQGGGGAVRDCYRTAYYVGGDPTTARVLLDLPPAQIQEHLLGQGTVILRSQTCKQASLVRVPKVDNQSLYDLLGPSTYVPGEAGADDEDELILEHLSPSSLDTSVLAPSLYVKPQPVEPVMKEEPTTKVLTQVLPPHLQRTLEIYNPKMPLSDLGNRLGVSKATAGRYVQELKDRRIIGNNKATNRLTMRR